MIWEAFKAFTRGQYKAHISGAIQDSQATLTMVELRAQDLEGRYSASLNRKVYHDMLLAYREVSLLRVEASRKIL